MCIGICDTPVVARWYQALGIYTLAVSVWPAMIKASGSKPEVSMREAATVAIVANVSEAYGIRRDKQ
jgi:hypothetical protein